MFGEFGNCHSIAQVAGEGFVDEYGLFGEQYRGYLGKVRASIEAMKQDGLDFWQKGFDGIDDFDPKVLKLFGVAGNTIDARWNIGATTRESSDDFQACEWACFRCGSDDFGERARVGRIESNNPYLDRFIRVRGWLARGVIRGFRGLG